MEVDFDFNPSDYKVECDVDGGLWIELNGKENVPTRSPRRFYTPKKEQLNRRMNYLMLNIE